ncbi:MAG: hypothetical protein K2G05_03490 [Duncaniella sp.]|nr:hypothetical protein [Duncaniella sp.]
MSLHRISLSSLSLLAVMLIGLLSVSCSKRGEILDTVPADVVAVATVDIESLCESAGVKFTPEGGIETIDRIDALVTGNLREALTRASALKASGAVDLSDAVVGVNADNETFITLAVSDAKALREATADYLTWSDDASSYAIAENGNTAFVANDSQLWIMGGSANNAIKSVETMLKSAKELSINGLDGISQVLARDNMVNMAVASGSMLIAPAGDTSVAPQEREWNVLALNVSPDNALVGESEIMQATGRTVVPKGMKSINPALLAYVPESFNFTFAAGLTPQFDWSPLKQIVTVVGGFQAAAFMSVITPYLESIDGTLLMALKLPDTAGLRSADPTDLDFIVMVRMPQDRVNGLISMIGSMCATAGVSPRMAGEGQMIIPQYGRDWYIGNVDGCFAISTIGFDNTSNNSLAPVFVNRDMAADLSFNLPDGAGAQLSATMTDGKGQFTFTIPGSQTPLPAHILSLLL